jgi:hypothetical protein
VYDVTWSDILIGCLNVSFTPDFSQELGHDFFFHINILDIFGMSPWRLTIELSGSRPRQHQFTHISGRLSA